MAKLKKKTPKTNDDLPTPITKKPLDAENEEKPWDICDDFLDPLADLLCQAMEDVYYPEDGPPQHFFPAMYMHAGLGDYAHELQNVAGESRVRLAEVWLQVHQSFELAEHVKRTVVDVLTTVRNAEKDRVWPDLSDAGLYLKDLSLVLRAKRAGTQLRMPDTQFRVTKTPPMTLICIAEILNVGRNGVKSLIQKEYSAEMQKRGKWRIPVELMPPGWEETFKKHSLARPHPKES